MRKQRSGEDYITRSFMFYSLPNIIRVIKSRRLRRVGHVARMGQRRGAYRVLVGKPEGKRPLGKSRHNWEVNIKIDLREVGWGRGAWTGSIWLRIGVHKMRGISASFAGRTLLHGVYS
jgi:hypothetical protein